MWYVWEVILGQRAVGKEIEQWRVNMGMTITQAAEAADMAATLWSRIEKGHTLSPYWSTIVRMFQAMGAVVNVEAAPGTRSWIDNAK